MLKFKGNYKIKIKIQKLMKTQELLVACQFTIAEQVSNNGQHFLIL
jgi:hypothetical protein